MNIQAEKLELVRLILDTDNPGILQSIKHIFSKAQKNDFWDSLPQYKKDDILNGFEEINMGDTVSYKDFIKKHQ